MVLGRCGSLQTVKVVYVDFPRYLHVCGERGRGLKRLLIKMVARSAKEGLTWARSSSEVVERSNIVLLAKASRL